MKGNLVENRKNSRRDLKREIRPCRKQKEQVVLKIEVRPKKSRMETSQETETKREGIGWSRELEMRSNAVLQAVQKINLMSLKIEI